MGLVESFAEATMIMASTTSTTCFLFDLLLRLQDIPTAILHVDEFNEEEQELSICQLVYMLKAEIVLLLVLGSRSSRDEVVDQLVIDKKGALGAYTFFCVSPLLLLHGCFLSFHYYSLSICKTFVYLENLDRASPYHRYFYLLSYLSAFLSATRDSHTTT